MKKHPAEIVLRALLMGLHVNLHDEVVTLEDDGVFIIRHTDDDEPVYLRYDGSLFNFIESCNELSEDQLAIISANITMNTLKGNNFTPKKDRP